MRRSPARALAPWFVVVLVVLAGCNGVFGSDQGGTESPADGDLTPAPVPNETAGTATPDPSELPPGVRPDRIASVSELRRAHETVVSESVTVTSRATVDGETSADGGWTTYVRNRSTYLQTIGESEVPVVYADPTGKYTREFDAENGAVTNVSDEVTVTGPRQDAPLSAGFSWLEAGSADVSRVERDGTTYVRIHTRRQSRDRGGNFDTVSLTAYVRPDGFVRTIVESRENSHRNGTTNSERRITYRNVGDTTVTEPDWVRREKGRRGLVDLPPATPAEGAPPGIGEERLYNVSALWDAHESVLANRSFMQRRVLTGPAGDVRNAQTVTLENRTTYAVWNNGRAAYYVDPTGTYIPALADDPPDNVSVISEPTPYDLGRESPYLLEAGSSVTPVERNGTTYFRVDLRYPPPGLSVETRNYSAAALVRPDGLVERVTVDLTVRRTVVPAPPGGSTRASREWVQIEEELVYRDVDNTTVSEPAWVTRVKRNRTNATATAPATPTDTLDGDTATTPAPETDSPTAVPPALARRAPLAEPGN